MINLSHVALIVVWHLYREGSYVYITSQMYQAKVPAAILSDIWLLPVGKLFSDLVKKCRVPGEYNLSWGLVGFGSATIQMANQNTVHMVDEVPQATFLHFDAEPCRYC